MLSRHPDTAMESASRMNKVNCEGFQCSQQSPISKTWKQSHLPWKIHFVHSGFQRLSFPLQHKLLGQSGKTTISVRNTKAHKNEDLRSTFVREKIQNCGEYRKLLYFYGLSNISAVGLEGSVIPENQRMDPFGYNTKLSLEDGVSLQKQHIKDSGEIAATLQKRSQLNNLCKTYHIYK